MGPNHVISREIFVLQVTIFKCESFLFPLTPLLKVKIDICTHFIVISDGFGLLQSLEPHHVLGVESPRELLKCFGGHVLCLRTLHVIKYEEQSLYRESLEELEGVKVCRRVLVVEGWRGARRPLQIWPDSVRVSRLRHVFATGLQHLQLVHLLLRQLHGSQGCYP